MNQETNQQTITVDNTKKRPLFSVNFSTQTPKKGVKDERECQVTVAIDALAYLRSCPFKAEPGIKFIAATR